MKRALLAVLMAAGIAAAGFAWASSGSAACAKPETEAQERTCLESDLARVRAELKALVAKIRASHGAAAAAEQPAKAAKKAPGKQAKNAKQAGKKGKKGGKDARAKAPARAAARPAARITASGFDIAAFDQANREFDSYVRHECEAVRSHVKGGTGTNAALACQVNLISSRIGALEMIYGVR